MSEIDYHQFLYRRSEKPAIVAPPAHPKRKAVKKIIFGVITVVVCFALAFFGADFFGKGVLTAAVTAAFSGKEYRYYIPMTPSASRFTAYADSMEIRQKGGAGYVFCDTSYQVAYAVFCEQSEANEVLTKNRNMQLFTVSYRSKNTELYDAVDRLTEDLCQGIDSFEKGNMTESQMVSVCETHKAVFSEKRSSAEKEGLIDLICSGLDGFSFTANRTETLSEMRYFLCCVVFSAQSENGA